jgi:hypothetical protein
MFNLVPLVSLFHLFGPYSLGFLWFGPYIPFLCVLSPGYLEKKGKVVGKKKGRESSQILNFNQQ